MTCKLEAPQCEQRNQIANVQAIGGWIKTAVNSARTLLEMLAQALFVRYLRDQPAPIEFIDEPGAHVTARFQRRAPYQKAGAGSSVVTA